MNSAQGNSVSRSQPSCTFETVDGLAIEVRRDESNTWIVETRGDQRRLSALHSFAEERARVAARMRNEAIASLFGAAMAATTGSARRLTNAVRTLVRQRRLARG